MISNLLHINHIQHVKVDEEALQYSLLVTAVACDILQSIKSNLSK